MGAWGDKKIGLEKSPELTEEERMRRGREWEKMPRYPGTVACIDSECSASMASCRETSEGVYCKIHYMWLPVCVKCGNPGTPQVVKKDGVKTRQVLCRSCYCGPIDEMYLLMERCIMMGQKSALGFAEELVMSSAAAVCKK